MRGLQGKVAIVTGGAASVGLAITEAFHEAGTRVAVAARSGEAGRALASRLGESVSFCQADIGDDGQLTALVEHTVRHFGRIDFVVNNAALQIDNGPRTTRKQWLEALDINLVSGAILSEMARPYLAQTRGAIVNIASVSCHVAQAGRWTYPVSKSGILQLTRIQAMDYARDGIRANSLVAGWLESAGLHALTGGDTEAGDTIAADYHLLGRVGRAREVADAVLFLCSDHASFTTGSELRVDGGYLAMGPEQAGDAMNRLLAATSGRGATG